jgi:hypothetical protein
VVEHLAVEDHHVREVHAAGDDETDDDQGGNGGPCGIMFDCVRCLGARCWPPVRQALRPEGVRSCWKTRLSSESVTPGEALKETTGAVLARLGQNLLG